MGVKLCIICTGEYALDPLYDLCATCFSAVRAVSRRDRIGASHAINYILSTLVAEEDEEVITKKVIDLTEPKAVKRKPVKKPQAVESKPSYRELEYDMLDIDTFEPQSREEELNFKEQMMDAALIAKDIEWAKALFADIKQLKERIR